MSEVYPEAPLGSPRPLTAPDVVAGLLADVAGRDERLAEVTVDLAACRERNAAIAVQLDEYRDGRDELQARFEDANDRGSALAAELEDLKGINADLRAASPDLQPDSESESSKALAARVRAVIARYKDDQVNALTAFADIMDAAGGQPWADNIEAASMVLFRDYESQYSASHLTWRDFADLARAVIEAARSAGGTP
jgi:hypothetical protein